MHAIVLAGGAGTRLRSVVSDVPKPLAPIGGRPFLAFLLDRLASEGFTSVTLSIGYLGEAIRAAMGTRHAGMALQYCNETEPLGTGGALRQALKDAPFPSFALNGDTYLELDYAAMLRLHRRENARLTMAVRTVDDTARYGRLVSSGGRITGYVSAMPGPGAISGGVYVFSENLLANRASKFSFEEDFLKTEIASLRPVAYETSGYFIDIGVPDDYARAQRELPGRVRA